MVDQKKLVEVAKETLARKDVKYIIGYKKGSYGFQTSATFAYTPKDVEQFIFTPLCNKNLAKYPLKEEKLPLKRGEEEDKRKIGLVVKGCDSRAIVQIIQENGMKREEVVLLGIPCPGVIDQKEIEKRFPNQSEITEINEINDEYVFTVEGKEHKIPKQELLAEVCKTCEYPNPVLYDVMIGEEVEVNPKAEYEGIKELEEVPLENRWEYWEEQFQRCIRCYACREACPLCYCSTCMVDLLEPQWIRRSVNISENTAWNIMRAFHLAGRCISCGACESACPMDIPLMELNKKLGKEVKEMFEYTPGLDIDAKPLLGSFNPDDPEEFIK